MRAKQVGKAVKRRSKQRTNNHELSVQHHITAVRQDSPEAAAIIEQILKQGGEQAVMRVTYIIAVLKLEVEHKQCVPDLKSYAFMVQDYEELRPLFEQAIGCCLEAWGLHGIVVDLNNGNHVMQIARI